MNSPFLALNVQMESLCNQLTRSIPHLIGLFFVALPQVAMAKESKALSFRELIIKAEFIVYADVVHIEPVQTEIPFFFNAKAALVIRETLQGTLPSDTIYVFFTPDGRCPKPEGYQVGMTVLAFLSPRKEAYFTLNGSKGVKPMNENVFKSYKQQIREMQSILANQNGQEKTEMTLDWIISCAINPDTQWEGVYELSGQHGYAWSFDPATGKLHPKLALATAQKKILRPVLFSGTPLNADWMGLVALVAESNDPEILALLVQNLRDTEPTWQSYFNLYLMELIAALSQREDLMEIAGHVKEVYDDYENFDTWDASIAKLTDEFLGKVDEANK